jgi:formyl-CoA transferase
MGNRHPSIAPYETLRCADGLLAVACGNDRQFQRLCDVLGVPEAADDDRFRANGDRVQHRPELVALLEERLAADTAAAWQERLTAVDVPAGEVNDIAQGIELAASLGLDPLVAVDGAPPQVAHPVRYSGFAATRPTPPPTLGQHDDEIRRWLASPSSQTSPTTDQEHR